MSEVFCKICGSPKLDIFAHSARCASCGVLLYWPYPKSDNDLVLDGIGKTWPKERVVEYYSRSSFYNHSNFTNMLHFAMDDSFKGRDLDILDYGGGGGQFALVCKSHFPQANVYITDICDGALLDEWRPLNIQILYKQFPANPRKFDLIFLNDVFEHVSDPLSVLNLLSTKLKDGGRIFIDTPKQFLIFTLTRLISKTLYLKVLKGTVSTSHLQTWTRTSFKLAVGKCGLNIRRYHETSEYSMPADYYMKNMGITNPLLRLAGRIFYKSVRYVSANKILCVLSKQ